MAFNKPSIISRVRELDTLEKIKADPELAPYVRNIYPLTRKLGNQRRTQKTIGEGSFGRVNLEEFNEGNVATKYFLKPSDNLGENIAEIAALKYLQGRPNVAQLVKVTSNPVSTISERLDFPAVLLGKAKTALNDMSLYTSWDDVYSAIVQILRGYYTLHKLGIAHRDTKPANMLMTNLGEVWISDFGTSKYTDKGYSQSKDTYTGTYWYCAPELLIKALLNNDEQDFFKSDAWAVGASIAHILRQRAPFPAEVVNSPSLSIKNVLDYIFTVKGSPDASDGKLFDLYKKLQVALREPIPSYDKHPNVIQQRLRDNSVHKPSDPAVLEAVINIAAGLLEYDPQKRLTIEQAIQMLPSNNNLPVLEPRPSITNQYILNKPLPSSMSEKIIDIAIDSICYIVNTYTFDFDNASKVFVLDRACVYLMAFLNTHKDKTYTHRDNLQLISYVALFIAAALFDNSPYQKYVNIDKLVSWTSATKEQVLNCIERFMTSDIDFYGKTFLDLVIQSQPSITQEEIETYGLLNLICFQKSLFHHYEGKLDVLQDTFIHLIKEEKLFPERFYFQEEYILGVKNEVKKEVQNVVNWITPLKGGASKKKQTRRVKRRKQNKTLKFRNG